MGKGRRGTPRKIAIRNLQAQGSSEFGPKAPGSGLGATGNGPGNQAESSSLPSTPSVLGESTYNEESIPNPHVTFDLDPKPILFSGKNRTDKKRRKGKLKFNANGNRDDGFLNVEQSDSVQGNQEAQPMTDIVSSAQTDSSDEQLPQKRKPKKKLDKAKEKSQLPLYSLASPLSRRGVKERSISPKLRVKSPNLQQNLSEDALLAPQSDLSFSDSFASYIPPFPDHDAGGMLPGTWVASNSNLLRKELSDETFSSDHQVTNVLGESEALSPGQISNGAFPMSPVVATDSGSDGWATTVLNSMTSSPRIDDVVSPPSETDHSDHHPDQDGYVMIPTELRSKLTMSGNLLDAFIINRSSFNPSSLPNEIIVNEPMKSESTLNLALESPIKPTLDGSLTSMIEPNMETPTLQAQNLDNFPIISGNPVLNQPVEPSTTIEITELACTSKQTEESMTIQAVEPKIETPELPTLQLHSILNSSLKETTVSTQSSNGDSIASELARLLQLDDELPQHVSTISMAAPRAIGLGVGLSGIFARRTWQVPNSYQFAGPWTIAGFPARSVVTELP
jgi:hypothetical protein